MMNSKFSQLDEVQEKAAAAEHEKATLIAEILVAAIRKQDNSAILRLIGTVTGSQLSAERLLTSVRDQVTPIDNKGRGDSLEGT